MEKESLKSAIDLIKVLNGNFNESSKIIEVPTGTTGWIYQVDEHGPFSEKTYETRLIRLIPFFGVFAAYDPEADILFISYPH